jgi:hypothetical protein
MKGHFRRIAHPLAQSLSIPQEEGMFVDSNDTAFEGGADETLDTIHIYDLSRTGLPVDTLLIDMKGWVQSAVNVESTTVLFPGDPLSERFWREHHDCQAGGVHGGYRYLVGRALSQNSLSTMELSNPQIALHMMGAEFCSFLSEKKQKRYGQMQGLKAALTPRQVKDGDDTMSPLIPDAQVPGPLSKKDVDLMYTKNRHSIKTNLPITPFVAEDVHAMSTLQSIARDFVARGHMNHDNLHSLPNIETNRDNYHQSTASFLRSTSKIAHRLAEGVAMSCQLSLFSHDPLVLYFIEWSDDFQPHHLKQMSSSLWIKTIEL